MKKNRLFIYFTLIVLSFTSVYGQIPAGYYNSALGLSGENLRTALKTVITNGHIKLSYSNIWNFYDSTDTRPAPNNNIIWDMYTDIPGGTPITTLFFQTGQCGTGGASAEGDCYSREHCFPNSWWGHFDDAAHPQYTDLHHLFPADQYVNMYKSNYPIGPTNTASYTSNNGSKLGPCSFSGYSGVVFEPINEYKGDFARAYLYIATRYMDSLGAWVKHYPLYDSRFIIDTSTNNYKQWFINMLLSWHNSDPVSSKEINRNNVIYRTAQHNRNPFIDHPEYVQAIWGGPVVIKQEPSNYTTNFQAINTSPLNSTITVNWTDASGAVIPDGYLVSASSLGFSQIQNPTDSIPETITNMQKIVSQGVQTAIFTGLTPGTVYYFKIFPFTNSGVNINFKTNGTIPIATTITSNLTWKEDFEIGSKTAYATDTVTCSMGDWIFYDALIGTSTSDRKNGIKAARLRYANLRMYFDKTGGVDTITIYHAKYGNDANAVWKLQISNDGGSSWNYVGNPVTSSDTILTPAVFSIKQPGSVRFNIETTSNTNRINIDDISITNYTGPLLSSPLLSADTTSNTVDNNIDIKFIDNAAWRANITSLKIENTPLIPTIDYVITAGNIQLKPSGANILLTRSGTKTILIEAFGYANDTLVQIILPGIPTSNSTVSVNSALAINSSRTISCTAKDQFNNPVSGYTFKYDLIVTNNNITSTENYSIDGTNRSMSLDNINISSATNSTGVSSLTVVIPSHVDGGDGIGIQIQLFDGVTNIGSSVNFSQIDSQTINFGTLSDKTYGDNNFSLTATASSGLPVNYIISDTSVAKISGNIVSILGVGSTIITASQNGNSLYYPATNISQTLTVNKKTITVSGALALDIIYNGSNSTTITGILNGIHGSDVVIFNGVGVFASINAGSSIAVNSLSTLSGADAAKYTLIQPVGLSANITKVPQQITFNILPGKTTTDQDFNPGATSTTSGINIINYSSSNLSVATIVSNQIHIVGAGTTVITASQNASLNYFAAADVLQTLTVNVNSGPIAAWDFYSVGSSSLPTYAATTFSSNLISLSGANNITRGPNAAWSTASNSFRTQGFKNEGISISNTDYFQITLTAATGYKVSISTIDAKFAGTSTYYANPGVTSQFAYSLNGSTFTLIGSPVQSTSLSMPQINLSSINELQNVSAGTTIFIRYYASGQTTTGGWGFYSVSSGTNGLAIGGSVSSASPVSLPTLSVSPVTSFENQCINTISSPKSFKITGTNLTTSTISVAAPNGYLLSNSSTGVYSSTLLLTQSNGNLNQDVFVKFLPDSAQTYNGEINVSGGGATSVNLSVSGIGINSIGGSLTSNSSVLLGGENAILTLNGNSGSISKWQKSNSAGLLWTDIFISDNPYSMIANDLGHWIYRAVVKNDVCDEANSNQIEIIVNVNSTTFTANINNNWNVTGNWNNGIPTKAFNVTIPPNKLAIVNSLSCECNNLTISALGNLTIASSESLSVYNTLSIQSDSSGSGSLIDYGNLNAASSNIECYIANPDQFHCLASSVKNQAIDSIISTSDNLYMWDEYSGNWISYTDANFFTTNVGNNFISGKSYAASFPLICTKKFTGLFNKDTITIPLTLSNNVFSGWNFIANPYPSAINWNTSNAFSRSMLEDAGIGEKAMWIWNPAIANYGCFVSNGIGTNGINSIIAASQGFWVKATSSGLFSINNNAREHSTQHWFKSSTLTNNMISIKLSGDQNPFSDETIISFGNSNGQTGAEKMFSMDANAPGIYTKKNNKNLCINYLTSISEYPIVELCIKAGLSGSYTLKFKNTDGFDNILLDDLQLGIQKNIQLNKTYNFIAHPTDIAERFLLHFTSSSNNSIENSITPAYIYTLDNEIYINSAEKIKEIFVYNMLGKLILKQTNNKVITKIHIENATAYYIIKLVTEKNVITKKVFIE
ncbi:MAG: endonuclease [Bacteroidales bacterium]